MSPLDCTTCGGSSPVSHEWCEHCGSTGREPCFYKFAGCTGTASQMVEGYGSCPECVLSAERDALIDDFVTADTEPPTLSPAEVLALSDTCWFCGDGKPVQTHRGYPACSRCGEAMREATPAPDTIPSVADDHAIEVALLEARP